MNQDFSIATDSTYHHSPASTYIGEDGEDRIFTLRRSRSDNLCDSDGGDQANDDTAIGQDSDLLRDLKDTSKSVREDQKALIKRVLMVVPGTMLGYWGFEVATFYLVNRYAPKQMIWARRAIEMAHSVISFLNATRGAFAGGKIKNYDYVWSVELGYYFYELSKVRGMDMLHHVVSIWSYVCLLIDVQCNKDRDSCERRDFYHSLIMMGLHFAEPWKDIARSIPNRTLKNLVWIFHHFAYSFRIILWPFLMVMNNKTNSLDKYTMLNAPIKCTVGSVIFFLMNCYWFWLKLRKFSFPE